MELAVNLAATVAPAAMGRVDGETEDVSPAGPPELVVVTVPLNPFRLVNVTLENAELP